MNTHIYTYSQRRRCCREKHSAAWCRFQMQPTVFLTPVPRTLGNTKGKLFQVRMAGCRAPLRALYFQTRKMVENGKPFQMPASAAPGKKLRWLAQKLSKVLQPARGKTQDSYLVQKHGFSSIYLYCFCPPPPKTHTPNTHTHIFLLTSVPQFSQNVE